MKLYQCMHHTETMCHEQGRQLLHFYAPVTIVKGHYDLPLAVRLSVCLSVRHALWYRVCVINSSHSF